MISPDVAGDPCYTPKAPPPPARPKFARQQAWRERNPFYLNLRCARDRCRNPKNKSWASYGGRGIRCLLTFEETRRLWERDNAAAMERPTIDRLNSHADYTFENCRFQEFEVNTSATRFGAAKRR